MAGVRVIAVNVATKAMRQVMTDVTGNYSLPLIKNANFSVTIVKDGCEYIVIQKNTINQLDSKKSYQDFKLVCEVEE